MRNKILQYRKLHDRHGLYALLLALDHYEETEQYLECHAIKTAIEQNAVQDCIDYPKRLSIAKWKKLNPAVRVRIKESAKRIISG